MKGDVVEANVLVAADDRERFRLCLRDKKAVERIAMMARKVRYRENVIQRDAELRDALPAQPRANERRGISYAGDLTETGFDRNFPSACDREMQLVLRIAQQRESARS
ncbi:MAG TPA: hypothetical protein VGX96_18825 [Candidatus Elarobacter sp.]|nr:hypothetical protein [Candidatus Elarobacter sp.]